MRKSGGPPRTGGQFAVSTDQVMSDQPLVCVWTTGSGVVYLDPGTHRRKADPVSNGEKILPGPPHPPIHD